MKMCPTHVSRQIVFYFCATESQHHKLYLNYRKDESSLREVKEQLREVEGRPIVGTSTANSLVQREIEKRWSKRSERKLNANLVQIQRQKRQFEEEVSAGFVFYA